MTASLQSHSVPSGKGLPQNSQKAIAEADILITAALADRPARQPNLEAQNQALHTLARQLTDDPLGMLKTLVRIAKELCSADTVGVSLLETASDGTSVFRWVAIAGALESLEQTTAPGNFSPCGTTIHCGQPQLYARPELYFTYLHHPQFPIVEGLLFPLCANDRQLGTIWIISHSEQRLFDREDLRLMTGFAEFTAAALQSIHLHQTAEEALQREQAARRETAATRQTLDGEAQRAVDILESITDAFVCLDREWRITYANREAARLNNLQPQEMIGKTHWEMWPWSVGSIVEQTYRQVVASQVAAHFEFFYEPLKMWVEVHAYPAPAGISVYFRDITARKQSEDALRESEEFNRSVFESSADCLKVLDIDGCLLSMNSAGCSLMEIEDCTPLVGTSWIQFWQYPDRANADNAVKTAVAGGTGRFSGYCPTAKGTPKWWEVVVTPISDVAGKPKQLLVTSRDVTERKLVEDAMRQLSGELERQLRKFDAIASSVPDFIYTFDLSGRFTYVNPALLDLWQKTAAEAVGKNFFELDYPTDLATKLQNQIQQVIETRQPLKDEMPYTSAFGARACEYIFVPLYAANGAVEAVAGVTRDITERKHAEEALREAQVQWESALAAGAIYTWRWKIPDDLVIVDAAFAHLFGIDPEMAAVGLPIELFVQAMHEEDRPRVVAAIKGAIATGEKYVSEYRVYTAPGEERWLAARGRVEYASDGSPIAFPGALADITERKLAEVALGESEEQIRRILESIAEAFFALDENWRFTYVNQAAETLLDRTPGDLIDKNLWEEYPGLIGNEWERIYWSAMRDRVAASLTAFYPDHDRWYEVRTYPAAHGITAYFRNVTDRIQSEAALRRSEERYRTLFESIDEGFCVVEMLFDANDTPIDYRFLEVNPAFEQQTGLRQAVGKTARQLVPDIEDRWIKIYGQVALTGESVRFESGSDAMNRWFDVYACRTGQPEARKVAIVFKDISDRKRIEQEREQAEKALLASEEQSRNILESITDGFFALDRNWRFTYVNRQAERLLGRAPGDLLGKLVWEEYPGIPGSEFERAYRQAADERVASSVTSFYPDHNRWYEAHVYPAANGITVYFRNVSDRKRVEEELRQKNAILEVINESAPSPIFVKDREGRIIYANPATLEVLGKSATEVIGYRDCDLYPSFELGATVTENDRRIMASGRTEVVEESPDGIRTFLSMKAPYRNEAGEVVGLIGISYDISDRVQLERDRERILQREQAAREAAENANRIKDEFLAVLSHELRSPLNPILGWSRLLQSRKLDEAKTALALSTIERNAKLQAELIEDLLNVSRILQGKLSLNVSLVNLASTILAAVETVRLAAEAKSIAVEVDLDPNVTCVSGDATRLQQVVWNLLSNAVKFTPAGGRVEIRLARADDRAQITVRDSGLGIASEFLPYVFDYFRQADSATTRKFGGLGLGLAIVRHLVELHGGTVEASSPGAGLGAAFTVRLPLVPIAWAENQPEQFSQSSFNLQGVRVLVVDDDTDTREFVVFLLDQAGAIVTSATSARHALAALTQSPPDILLSDIGMPDMDGYMLMRQVRALPPEQGGQIPAIALTAYAGDFNQKQALAAGFQRHVAKPVEPNELLRAIATLLRTASVTPIGRD